MYLFRGLARVFYFIQTRPAPKRTLLKNESSSTCDRGVFELGAFQTGALEGAFELASQHVGGGGVLCLLDNRLARLLRK
jgi:hypothetical protein